MSHSQLLKLLANVPFLHDVEEDKLSALARALEKLEFTPGEEIALQGARADAIYFIASGAVDLVTRQPGRAISHRATLLPGDIIGEMEIISPQVWANSAVASQASVVYRWRKGAVAAFMKEHPAALQRLRFSAHSRRLSQSLHFNWLAAGEVVYAVARKHFAVYYQALSLPIVLIALACLLGLWGLSQATPFTLWIAAGIGLASLGLGLWRWVDWRNDFYIVTDRRVVWLEKVVGIYDNRLEAPLHMVLSVSVSTDVMGRMLGYGNVIIRTFTGRLTFENVGNPHAMAAVIEEHWRRRRMRQDETEHDDLRHMVLQRLEPEEAQAQPAEAQRAEELIDETPDIETSSIGPFNFKVRFKDRDVITYRKHWAVLLRTISLPSAALLLLAGLIGTRLAGFYEFLTLEAYLFFATAALLASALWWLYRYLDWANDIYQITPEQIVDVNKKPLSREERKVASLENILGTEVDRKGIVGLLLNYGDVVANIGTEQFTFHGVYDPLSVQQDIVHAQEAFLQRKLEHDRLQRRNEMIELINIYHDEYASRKKRGERDDKR